MSAAQKRRGRPPKAEVASYADFGPRIRHEPLPGAAMPRVVLTYRADPDNPSGVGVRGAEALIIYDWLQRQGFITDAQREAADRYCRRLDEAGGYCEGAHDPFAERVQTSRRDYSPNDRRLDAETDLRGVDEAMGAHGAKIVREVLAWNCEPPGGLDVGQFRAALQRAAEHWGMT